LIKATATFADLSENFFPIKKENLLTPTSVIKLNCIQMLLFFFFLIKRRKNQGLRKKKLKIVRRV